MKQRADINLVYRTLEEVDFEGFDDLFSLVERRKAVFALNDIVLLCEILAEQLEYMEPHQFAKIQEMILFTAEAYDQEKSFMEMAKGLVKSIDKNPFESSQLIRMTMNSFCEESLIVFSQCIKKCTLDFVNKVIEIISNAMDSDYSHYGNKGSIMLQILQNDVT